MSERIVCFKFANKEYAHILNDVHAWQLCEFLRYNKIEHTHALWFSRDRDFNAQKCFEDLIKFKRK